MKRRRHARLPLSLAMLLLAAAGATAKRSADRPAVRYEPEPEAVALGVVTGETWTFDGGDYTLTLRRLDDSERLAFIRERTGIAFDPFAPRPGRTGRYPTFLLELRNQGDGALSLHPLNCWLVDGVVPSYPLDVPTIESSYTMAEQPMPPAFRRLNRALLDGEIVVTPGGEASGLLVYRPLKPKSKRFRVEVQVTTPAGHVNRFAAGYRRAKKNR